MALTEAQHIARSYGLGGSDMPVVAGMSHWKTRVQLWLEKTGQVESTKAGEAAYWGTQLEELIAQEFAKRTGMDVRRHNATLVHPAHPWLIGHIDRKIVGRKEILECKATDRYLEAADEAHVVQCYAYMALTGAEAAHLAYLLSGREFKMWTIERDQEAIEALIELGREFWHNVETMTPPEPVNLADIAALYPKDYGVVIEASDDVIAATMELAETKSAIKELEERSDACEMVIKQAMGGSSALFHEGRSIATWKAQTAKRLDTARLKTEQPDVYEAYLKETTSRVFRLAQRRGE